MGGPGRQGGQSEQAGGEHGTADGGPPQYAKIYLKGGGGELSPENPSSFEWRYASLLTASRTSVAIP